MVARSRKFIFLFFLSLVSAHRLAGMSAAGSSARADYEIDAETDLTAEEWALIDPLVPRAKAETCQNVCPLGTMHYRLNVVLMLARFSAKNRILSEIFKEVERQRRDANKPPLDMNLYHLLNFFKSPDRLPLFIKICQLRDWRAGTPLFAEENLLLHTLRQVKGFEDSIIAQRCPLQPEDAAVFALEDGEARTDISDELWARVAGEWESVENGRLKANATIWLALQQERDCAVLQQLVEEKNRQRRKTPVFTGQQTVVSFVRGHHAKLRGLFSLLLQHEPWQSRLKRSSRLLHFLAHHAAKQNPVAYAESTFGKWWTEGLSTPVAENTSASTAQRVAPQPAALTVPGQVAVRQFLPGVRAILAMPSVSADESRALPPLQF